MKLWRIVIIVLSGCVLAAGMYIAKYHKIADEMLSASKPLSEGIILIDSEKELSGAEFAETDCNPGIYFEGTLLPYDKENNRLYLPQNYTEEEWYGSLSAVIDGAEYPVYLLKDEMWDNKSEAIRTNHDFVLVVETDREAYRFLLTVTGMPLISVVTEREEEAEEIAYEEDPDKLYYGSETRYYGEFLMLNPETESGQYEITEAGICYHYKGATSATFEKKGYSFELLDYKGNSAEISLAGLRCGSKWKLNALYTDVNRIREITASQLWEQIDAANPDINEAGPNMEYVELIVDNEYKGIYCLVEPIDEDKLELDKNDVLYKVIDWFVPDDEAIQGSVDMGWRVSYPIRIRYPKAKEIVDYSKVWQPIRDYLNTFYRGGEIQYEEAVSHINLENFADMLLFTMAVSASDNSYKNTYYVAESTDDSGYVIKAIPWDLDYTFGNVYQYGAVNNVLYEGSYTKVYAESTLSMLWYEAQDEIGSVLLERWAQYRENILSTDNILKLLNKNRDYLIETGAVLREQERWPEAGVDMDIDYLLDFQIKRMEWLDNYFDSWLNGNS